MATLFLRGLEQAYKGGIVVGTDSFRLAFMAPSYTPNATTDEYFDDVSASVASGTTVRSLTNVTVTINGTDGRIQFDADNVSEDSVTTSTNKFIVYKWTGDASTSTLIGSFDITEGTLEPINGTLTLSFSANGIFGIKATPV